MTVLPHVTVYILGLDPLNNLTPMDGIVRALRRLNWSMTLVGVSTNTHHSGNILSEMFDHVIMLRSAGNERFNELATLISSVQGPKILIPTTRKDAMDLSHYRLKLSEMGLCCPGPSPAQSSKTEAETINYLANQGIKTVDWIPCNSMVELVDTIHQLHFPVKLTSVDRNQRHLVYDPVALNVYADRIFAQNKPVILRSLGAETVYQTATVIGSNWKPAGWGLVREIAATRTVEPWIFLSVDSQKLQNTATQVAMALEYQGPITMRFIYSETDQEYLLDTFAPILPPWTDLAAHCGINLPGRLLETCIGHPVTLTPFTNCSGQMLTFNSFDISLPSDTWLNLAGRGGF